MSQALSEHKYEALDQYLKISRQWHGHGEEKLITVSNGLRALEDILTNMELPSTLRSKAAQLQLDVILFNQTPPMRGAVAHG